LPSVPQSPFSDGAGPRLPELDTVRGIAILAVTGLHASWPALAAAPAQSPAGQIVMAIHLGCGFGVPLFLVVSAVGLSRHYNNPFPGVGGYVAFLMRRAGRLLPAYVTWSLVTVAILQPERLQSVLGIARVLGNGSADVQFYFVPLIFQLYLVWPAIRLLVDFTSTSRVCAVATVAVAATVSSGWWKIHDTGMIPQGTWGLLPLFLVYVCIGVVMAGRVDQLRALARSRVAIAIVAAATCIAAANMFTGAVDQIGPHRDGLAVLLAVSIFNVQNMVYSSTATVLIALLAFRIEGTTGARYLQKISTRAYGIFLVHMLLLTVVVDPRAVDPGPSTGTAIGPVVTLLIGWTWCTSAGYALVSLLERVPLLRFAVSNRGLSIFRRGDAA